MAIFGEQDYSAPFGVIKPEEFFDSSGNGIYNYSGFSSRKGDLFLHSQYANYSGFSAYCGEHGLPFRPFKPTLIFPLNYEALHGQVTISWSTIFPPHPCNYPVTFEIQFTRNFSKNYGWSTIADKIPANSINGGYYTYIFDVSNIPFTEDGGLRIRSKDFNYLTSDWEKTISAFTIANHPPEQVEIISPITGDLIDNQLIVIWKEANPRDIDGHNVIYKIEITHTASSNSNWVTVPNADQLPEGTTSFKIDTSNFPDGNDFGIRITSIDQLGATSDSVKVNKLTINHSGIFFIDTIPPEGSLIINDGQYLATTNQVKLSLFATDKITGIKDVRFKNEIDTSWGNWKLFSEEKFWNISLGDGVKRVFVQYRDFANNISQICDCEIINKVLIGEGNVTDIEVFGDKLYVAFDQNGNLLEYKVLIETANSFNESEVVALAITDSFLYIATYDSVHNLSVLYNYAGVINKLTTINTAKITTMVGLGTSCYIGFKDGRIMIFDGSSLSTSHTASAAISRLRTDGSLIFAAIEASGEFLTFNGVTWSVNII